MMTCQLAAGHSTDGVNEVTTVEVFKPILIQVMSVGPMVEVGSGGVLDPVLITSILKHYQLM